MRTLNNPIKFNQKGYTKVLNTLLSVLVLILFITLAVGSDQKGNSSPSTPDNTDTYIIAFGVIAIIGIIAFAIWNSGRIERLKREYEAALRGTNKQAALTAGRKYYSAAKMATFNSEQAINNDIAAMDDARKNF